MLVTKFRIVIRIQIIAQKLSVSIRMIKLLKLCLRVDPLIIQLFHRQKNFKTIAEIFI